MTSFFAGGFHQYFGGAVIVGLQLHKVKRILLAEINTIAVGAGNDGGTGGVQISQHHGHALRVSCTVSGQKRSRSSHSFLAVTESNSA